MIAKPINNPKVASAGLKAGIFVRLAHRVGTLSLSLQFMLASFIVLVTSMIGIGSWVGQQIAAGVIHRSASTTALYVDSFIAPHLQELGTQQSLSPDNIRALDMLFRDTPLGKQIIAFKVWDVHGRILYSSEPGLIGETFPVQGNLERAWQGAVAARISDLDEDENIREREQRSRLLEIYSPVRLDNSGRVIAVAEFYQTIDEWQGEIADAQHQSWLVVGMATLAVYLLLAGFVRRASNTITMQRAALHTQVDQLTELLGQNAALHERIRRAALRTTALNERVLRRIGAELHDGPAQDLGLALLRLDHVLLHCETYRQQCSGVDHAQPGIQTDLELIQQSLQHAMQEVRAISAGMGLPQLGRLSIKESVLRVIRTHERRTSTKVIIETNDLPEQASLPVKITLYRVIQEALTNAYRHGGGLGQRVRITVRASWMQIEVADQGPGFQSVDEADWEQHMGLVGMRERVESLGGHFQVESSPGTGTRIHAILPLHPIELANGRGNDEL